MNKLYLEDPDYNEFVYGKRIVIVGRSEAILHSPEIENQGEYIDSFDLVVRVNNPHVHDMFTEYHKQTLGDNYIHPDFHNLLGKRADIMYAYQMSIWHEVKRFANNGGKIIIREPYCDFFSKERISDDSNIKSIVPYTRISHSFYHRFRNEVGANPFTGTAAVAHLLTHDIKELRVLGFTCVNLAIDSNPKDYKKSAHDHKVEIDGYHKRLKDLEWFKKQVDTDSRLKVGSTLTSIFKLHEIV